MPASLLDYLTAELDKALERQPDDRARIVLLARESGSWQERYRSFAAYGKHPFGNPPPGYDPMTAGDFLILLGKIDGTRAKIERQAVLA